MINATNLNSRGRTVLLCLTLCLAVLLGGAVGAHAATPGWAVRATPLPSNFAVAHNTSCNSSAERCDAYLVTATNVGGAPTNGETIAFREKLPEHVVVHHVYVKEKHNVVGGSQQEPESPVMCTGEQEGATELACEYSGIVKPGSVLEFGVELNLEPGVANAITDLAEIEGGGAALAVTAAPTTTANTVNGTDPPFGLHAFGVTAYGAGGTSDVQAGDHPESLMTSITFNSLLQTNEVEGNESRYRAIEEPKTEVVNLPLGLTGDPLAAPTCLQTVLRGSNEGESGCPTDSKIGTVQIERGGEVFLLPLSNVAPEPGYPAEFGFELAGTIVQLRARVLPSPAGYVLSVAAPDVPRSTGVKVTGVTVTIFGNPAQVDQTSATPIAMFTNPTNCSASPQQEEASLELSSWVNPNSWSKGDTRVYEASPTQAISGCDLLQFQPFLSIAPERAQVDEPSGYEAHVSVPQTGNVAPVRATPDLRDATFAFPQGVAASPAVASGLVACQKSGSEGIELGTGDTSAHEAGEGEEITADGLPSVTPGHCPAASRLGDVEVTTPVLAQPLHGHLFLAQPECGGPGAASCSESDVASGKLAPVYLEIAGSGVIVKLKGQVDVNPADGQLTASFDENPQFPFDSLEISLYGGSRAPLANPQTCGPGTVFSQLLPWSAPESGVAASPSSTFGITGCGSGSFSPSFLAQTTNATAGAHSTFQLTLARKDGEPNLSAVGVSMPLGLLGTLANVQQCPEPAASQGTCGGENLIGHVQVAAGSGGTPFWTSGNVFLTGPYHGGPFGLSIVVPTVAGPFRLAGNNGDGSEVVRAAIFVNPTTAAISVISDPIPLIVDGVQLRLKTVSISIDREGFIFNPTNCNQQQVTASVGSTLGGGASGPSTAVSASFAVTGCKNLPFKPGFSASTAGKASKATGASLDVKVSYPSGPQGTYANIKSVRVDLPKQLPARLTTLQKACVASVFDANPANCPAASNIGMATASTPVLSAPLVGPAYLVSHGGEAFPDLEIVLQGEGITLILDGNTQIKKGITSSTFKAIPDAPVSGFELKLPTGKYSILSANVPQSAKYSLCGQTLAMPTVITGQNGAVIKQTTSISVTGCAKAKTLTRAQKLTAALKACHRKAKAKRPACEKQARKKYGSSGRRKKK
jgi:hypothetical protein